MREKESSETDTHFMPAQGSQSRSPHFFSPTLAQSTERESMVPQKRSLGGGLSGVLGVLGSFFF